LGNAAQALPVAAIHCQDLGRGMLEGRKVSAVPLAFSSWLMERPFTRLRFAPERLAPISFAPSTFAVTRKRFYSIHDYGRDWPSRYDLVQSQRAGFCTGRAGAGALRRVQQQAGGDRYAERAVRGVASAGVVGGSRLLGLGGHRTVFLDFLRIANWRRLGRDRRRHNKPATLLRL